MSELINEQNALFSDEADFAIDKEIVVEEDEIEPVDITDLRDKWDAHTFGADEEPKFDVVNLPSVKDEMSPIEVEEMPFEEDKDNNDMFSDKSLDDFQLAAANDELVVEEDVELVPGSDAKIVEEKEDDAKDQKVTDWAHDGDHSKFIIHITERKNSIPRHSGETIPGCERAKSYLRSLDNEISKAMRSDLKGAIDEQQVDALRKEIEMMADKLDKQINKLKKKQRKANLEVRLVSEGQCNKCESIVPMWHDIADNKMVCMHCEAEVGAEESECVDCVDGLEKVATTPVINVYCTPFERAIVGILINATVSGGKNINEVYEKLKKKYAFTDREELSVQQLVADYGYPVYLDRGRIGDKNTDQTADGVDWQSNYYA